MGGRCRRWSGSTRRSARRSQCRSCSRWARRRSRTRSATRTTPQSAKRSTCCSRWPAGAGIATAVRLVDGDGLIGAAYRHRTSRAAEPHLHTHVVIPNLVYALEDQRWSALDARPLFAWCKPVGHLYRAQLRHELTTRLGVGWGRPVKGLAEMTGFTNEVLRAFSTRRREIEQELSDTGQSRRRRRRSGRPTRPERRRTRAWTDRRCSSRGASGPPGSVSMSVHWLG